MNTKATYRQVPTQTIDIEFQYCEEFLPEVLKTLGPSVPTSVPTGSLVRGLDAGATA
jgi:hypothetical protein